MSTKPGQLQYGVVVQRPQHKPKITVLLCALNEAENLPHVLPKIPDWVDEVLVVDGHSSDGTVGMAQSLCPRARILLQPGKGKGDALIYGFASATGDIIVTLDADGSTDPQEMERFIRPLLNGYDFVKGSRFRGRLPHNSFIRILGNLGLAFIFDILFLRGYTDVCSGYNAFWKTRIQKVTLDCHGDFPAEPTLHSRVAKAGLRVKEVGHRDLGRIAGFPKVPIWWRHGLWILQALLRERFRD